MPRSPKLLPALALVPLLALVGFVAGGLLAGRVLSSGTGFDALADALSGMIAGTLVGIVVAVLLVRALPPPALRRTAWIALALLAGWIGLGLLLRATDGGAGGEGAGEPPRPTAPSEPN